MRLRVLLSAPGRDGAGTANARRAPDVDRVTYCNRLIYAIDPASPLVRWNNATLRNCWLTAGVYRRSLAVVPSSPGLEDDGEALFNDNYSSPQ